MPAAGGLAGSRWDSAAKDFYGLEAVAEVYDLLAS
jgi:hypothetical protein